MREFGVPSSGNETTRLQRAILEPASTLQKTLRYSQGYLPLERQTSVGPVLLPAGIFSHIGITQRHQLTGGVLCGVSGSAGAVDHDIGRFVWQPLRREIPHLNGREVDCSANMTTAVCGWWQGLHQRQRITAIERGLELALADEGNVAVVHDHTLAETGERASEACRAHRR